MFTLAPTQPEWVVLFPASGDRPEVAVQFDPITIRSVRAARRACALALEVDREDIEEAGDALSRELIRRGVRAWRGIGAADGAVIEPQTLVPVLDADGEPVLDAQSEPVMQPAVEVFIADPRTFEVADRKYVVPWMRRDREGNVSSASPSGTGGAATPASDIATPPANGGPTAVADPTPPPATTGATTSVTRRRRKKA